MHKNGIKANDKKGLHYIVGDGNKFNPRTIENTLHNKSNSADAKSRAVDLRQ